MPFPFVLGDVEIESAGALGFAVAFDLREGGGQVYVGVGPEAWIPLLVADGRLNAEELRSLVRALLGAPEPTALALAVDLCDRLQPTGVGPWLIAALTQHDLGTLMAEIGRPTESGGRTVEELLARAAARHADLSDPELRDAVVRSLQAVGAMDAEADVLAREGTPEELDRYGPALVSSADPAVRAALEAGLDGPAGDVIGRLLG